MKGYESLRNSYEKQKEIFETARSKRIANRKQQIDQITQKINDLQVLRDQLISQNKEEKEFESFDSFRLKAEEQSRNQKREKKES